MAEHWLHGFVAESNRIEGIRREPTTAELHAHIDFLNAPRMWSPLLTGLVEVVAPGHRLRDKAGLDVRVGSHVAPPGGPAIARQLDALLDDLDVPYRTHIAYETLHPFTDGNGRSGRALWLWQMLRTDRAEQAKALGFLHTFYYQTLEHSDQRR